jgi:serine/threonine-protein kinase
MTLLNNRYRILQTLAGGGCGQTFLAEDTHLPSKRRCIVKQLKPATSDPASRQIIKDRFEREAAILESIDKFRNQIPELYAYFEDSCDFYLVQEWIDGETLTQRVKQDGVFNGNDVKDILFRILPVLQHLHTLGIIHRDIKPDNIILRRSDSAPVLIDFGAVKEIVTTIVNPHGASTSIVIGSPGFMPLEQAAGKPVFASDLYSLGLTAVYLLTGMSPAALTDPNDGSMRWWNHAPFVSQDLLQILNKAIRPLAQDRFHSTTEMLRALTSRIDLWTPYIRGVMLKQIQEEIIG